jgi:LmbE family N-acetylglucosaminyl deacetylase
VIHPPITEDIAIMHEPSLIKKAAAVIRTIKPSILLVPSPQDFMEDHQNACRILVTAAFVKGIRNYRTSPSVEHWNGATTLYHAMPHGLRDSLRKRVRPGQYVDISSVMAKKRTILSMHRSQKEWLDISQGIDSYLQVMESMAREVGTMSGHFEYAEGWRRHSHLGFGPIDDDPLSRLLGNACGIDPEYEQSLG